MDSEKRRAIFENILGNIVKRGDKFEDDPGFRASLEEWIVGDIGIDELRARYRSLTQMPRNANALNRVKVTAI